jgi:hypothetical protein
VGNWYTIGLAAGLGTALGVLLAGFLGRARGGLAAAAVLGALLGAAGGVLLGDLEEAVAAGAGALLGGAGATAVVSGAMRRGGTGGGVAALVALGALVLAALALVPILGYVEAVVVPALAARLRRRSPETYAGLRSLARD